MDASVISQGKPVDANIYWNMLKDLSMDIKLDLISRLSNSLRNKDQVVQDVHWTADFAGRWSDCRSAEEIIDDIRKARTVNREVDL